MPYWREISELAAAEGVRIAIEMHPRMLVYHPESMPSLRAA